MDNVEKVARAIFRAMHPHAVQDWSNQGRYKEAAQAALQSIGYERMREAAARVVELDRERNFMRTADYHDQSCECWRCSIDKLDAALKGDTDRG